MQILIYMFIIVKLYLPSIKRSSLTQQSVRQSKPLSRIRVQVQHIYVSGC